MILVKNAYAKIWKVTKKENYIMVNATTSEKDQNGGYKNSTWLCKFVGKAKEKSLAEGDRIKITSGKIENIYDKESEKSWLNLIVFDFENLTDEKKNGYVTDYNLDDLPF